MKFTLEIELGRDEAGYDGFTLVGLIRDAGMDVPYKLTSGAIGTVRDSDDEVIGKWQVVEDTPDPNLSLFPPWVHMTHRNP
jgi:hypothetical protein